MKRKKGKKKSSNKFLKFLKIFIILAMVATLAIGTVGIVIAKEAIDKLSKEEDGVLKLDEQSVIYDKNGNLISTIGRQRKSLKYEEIPEVFIESLLAIEDSRFFAHDGVDRPRLVKAALFLGKRGGASTLTMQVSKNQVTKKSNVKETTMKKVERKIQDLYVVTNYIEKTYTKEEILAFYSNSLYLGNYSYGLAAASNNYFQKDPSELNLAESSFLAGLFQSPAGYDPTINGSSNAEARRNSVLDLMVRHGYISQEICDSTKSIPLSSYLNTTSVFNESKIEYSDYINAVITEVKEKTGLNPYKDSMKIYTNMDPVVQNHLYTIKNKDYYYNDKVLVASTIIDNSNGTVAGILSGRENNQNGLNYATALQQPGSIAKPLLDYAPCFEQGNCTSINETIADEKYSYSNGTPIRNWDGGYSGTMTLKAALSESRNIPALKIFQRNDSQKTIAMAKSMGLHLGIDPSNGDFYEAHSIGGYTGESTVSIAGAYSAFARGGLYSEPTTLNKVIIDYSKNDAETIEYKNSQTRVMTAKTADAINQMLISSSNGYFNEIDGYGINFALKTGTSNWDHDRMAELGLYGYDSRDNWIAVYSPEYTTSLWYGYDHLDEEYVANGWYMKGYNEINIKYLVGRDIAVGPHQPRVFTKFPNWGVANSNKITKEVAKDGDEDKDGIKNKNDECKETPNGDKVDSKGCTVVEEKPVITDSDGDGINDQTDKCPNTQSGKEVDEFGCEVVVTPPDTGGDTDTDGGTDTNRNFYYNNYLYNIYNYKKYKYEFKI
ncbi:MAG: transglycosylase domain-containing protein [Bacilli bacterium]